MIQVKLINGKVMLETENSREALEKAIELEKQGHVGVKIE